MVMALISSDAVVRIGRMCHPVKKHTGPLPDPASVLEKYFRDGGVSLIHAIFENSFFVVPDDVRSRPVYYPDRARLSRQHYPGIARGGSAEWKGRRPSPTNVSLVRLRNSLRGETDV